MSTMNEFQFGPSSVSTLYFVPDFIKEYIDKKTDNENASEQKSSNTAIRSSNKNSVNDFETLAFVAFRDVIKISDEQLRQLYNYNKREYSTFGAVILNSKCNYKELINEDEVRILYHFFSGVSDTNSWMEICSDLGFAKFFNPNHIQQLYETIRNLPIRVQETQKMFQFRFFMQLLMYFWDNANNINITDNFAYFWVQTLSKTIKFIGTFAVGRNIEIYCLLLQKWKTGTIITANKPENQIYIQYLDGSNKHEYISFFSPRLAPMAFQYFYAPNMTKLHNLPCVVSVLTQQLNSYAQNRAQPRYTLQREPKGESIPNEGWWYYNSSNNTKIGPISLSSLFMGCAGGEIHPNTPIFHQRYGQTSLSKLPQIVEQFRKHIQKCKIMIDRQMITPSSSSMTGQASIFTSSASNSSFNPRNNSVFGVNFNHRHSDHKNKNYTIPESDVNEFRHN